jgi:tryptophan halogenase
MLGYVYDVQDFIDAHYKLSARRDTEFWKYQTSRKFPDRLEHRLALYAEDMPTNRNRLKSSPWAFHEISWLDILNGYNFRYEKIDVDPRLMTARDQTIAQITAREPYGLAPLDCSPQPNASTAHILINQ